MCKYYQLTKKIFLIFCLSLLTIDFAYAHNIDRDKIEKIVEEFLVKNPKLIKSTLDNLEISFNKEKEQSAINLLSTAKNPGIIQKNADITIYEFFDYNCGYCKSVVKILMDTVTEDAKINLILVEYPILSEDSYKASLAALAAKKQGLYNQFHLSLMKSKGRVNEKLIFQNAEKVGLNVEQLKKDMNSSEIQFTLNTNRKVAELLALKGTPAFIIGDIIYPGAIKKKQLKAAIKLYRKS